MSYEDGLAAINLQMPPRVPRTEYSVHGHWELLKTVTGIDVDENSPQQVKERAQNAFFQAWNFDFFWNTLIGRSEFAELCTNMGHAEYAAGGVDRNDGIYCPFTDPEQVLSFDPAEAYGKKEQEELTRRFESNHRKLSQSSPMGVCTTGIYVTLMSGLIDIFGWDMLLLSAGTDLKRFGALTDRYAAWIQQYFDALAEADVPVVMVHDDIVWTSGPFISPDWYREHVFPHYRRFFAPLRDSGKRIAFTSDGNYTMFIDDIASAGAHGFVMEPTTDMAYVADKYGKTHFFIGNADTRILLGGTRQQIRAEVERCMAIGKRYAGFFMAVGNHIPSNTPVENALYYNEVYQELSKR